MEVLQSYLSMVDTRLLYHIQGKSGEFVKVLKEKRYISEEAFIVRLCGKDYDIKQYQKRKSSALKILQALAIVSASSGASLVRRKADLCRKNFAIGQKFLKRGERNEGLRLIKQAYQVAVEYNFTHLACEISSILFHDNVYYPSSHNRAIFYANKLEEYLYAYTTEKKAQLYFLQTIKEKKGKSYIQKLEEAILKINRLEGTSLMYLVFQSMLKVLHGLSVANYSSITISCTQIIKVFEHKKGVYDAHYQFFLTKKGIAHMILGEDIQADNSFTLAGKYAHTNSFNDYLLRLYKTINALYSGKYQLAYELYRQNRKCRFEEIRQQFAIIEAYVCFLSHMGYLKLNHIFRLGKYLNDTISSQSNKQGENIAILIAELLIYLSRNRGKYIDRIEAIQSYSYRHLKREETERAKRFIKILCNLPRSNFHPIALNRNMERHIKYLKNHPIRVGENVTIIEFIPFDKLLEMILEKLDSKVG